MKQQITFLLILFSISISVGQNNSNANYIFWSSKHKFTVDDFVIKTKNLETNPSFAQFTFEYQVGGLDFMSKNFNKKVRNYMIKSASWIDTTFDVAASLKYQQTLFNICEIYARKFRKDLKENKKKIISGTHFIDELNSKAMTDFSNRRVEYDSETNFGSIAEKQVVWELQIQKELDEFKDFSNE